MNLLRRVYEKLKVNGKVRNHSSKTLWVIENGSSKPIAHKLLSGMKSPPSIDCDGIKRVDGKPIEGHIDWWKIYDFITADVYDYRSTIKIHATIKSAVSDNEFGNYTFDNSNSWGEHIAEITKVRRNQSGIISEYFIEQYGWISKEIAIELAAHGKIDNATPVFPKGRAPYLRSRPDTNPKNNLGSMVV